MPTKSRDELDNFYQKNKENFNTENVFATDFMKAFQGGDRTVYQKNMSEIKMFDDEWIKTIESYFPSIDKITRDPKSTLKYEEDIVPVEKAKKTTQKTVMHLSANTQLIKDISDDGFVTPSKVLIDRAEQDYAIYENRFIKTLAKRLYYFVRNRYEVIKNNVESYQKDHVNAQSTFDFNNTKVNMTIDLEITKDLEDKSINEHNKELLERVETLNYKVNGLRNCQFMKMLDGTKDVHPPIMKTNIIAKNPDFRNAYNLWLFLDKYSILGYDTEVTEKNLEFDDDYITELEHLFLLNYSTILANQKERADLYSKTEDEKTYTRKKTKVAKTHPLDFVPNPDLIQMEDTTLNEYFLNKYKEIFDKSINAYARDPDDDESIVYDVVDSSDEAIKKALRVTLDIANSLYEAKFNFEEEGDIFTALVTEVDLDKEYLKSKEQLRYSYLIHDVKRVDFNNSIRLERKTIKDLEQINKQMIEKLKEKKLKETSDKRIQDLEEKIEQKKAENEALKKQIEELDDFSKLTKDEELKLNEERVSALAKVVNDMKVFDAELKAKFEQERARLASILEKEKATHAEILENQQRAIKNRRTMILSKLAMIRKENHDDFVAKKNASKAKYDSDVKEIEDDLTNYKDQMTKEYDEIEAASIQQEKEDTATYLVKIWEEKKEAEQATIEQEHKQEVAKEKAKAKALKEKKAHQDKLVKALAHKKDERSKKALERAKNNREKFMIKQTLLSQTEELKALNEKIKDLKQKIIVSKEKAKQIAAKK